MPPILLHIYGPISIHTFGVMIVLGLIITLYLLHHDTKLKTLLTDVQIETLFQISFVSAIAGGRIWFLATNSSMITHWTDCFTVWSGGLSILGAIICTFVCAALYIYFIQRPVLKTFDRIALYIPLLQSISRLGCFFAGCCYGKPTNLAWAVMYTHPDSLAPLHVHLHPTQIYSSIALAFIFILLILFDRYYKYKKPGQIVFLYLMLIGLERFSLDFLRDNRELFTSAQSFHWLSIQQMLALSMFLAALIMVVIVTRYKKSQK